jgi:hypothetical protein
VVDDLLNPEDVERTPLAAASSTTDGTRLVQSLAPVWAEEAARAAAAGQPAPAAPPPPPRALVPWDTHQRDLQRRVAAAAAGEQAAAAAAWAAGAAVGAAAGGATAAADGDGEARGSGGAHVPMITLADILREVTTYVLNPDDKSLTLNPKPLTLNPKP